MWSVGPDGATTGPEGVTAGGATVFWVPGPVARIGELGAMGVVRLDEGKSSLPLLSVLWLGVEFVPDVSIPAKI